MPEQYIGKTPEQRLRDRLRNSGDDKSWPASHSVETQPTRTYTNIHKSAMQQNATRSGQPRGSHPEAVGVGGGFFTSDNAEFERQYGAKPRGGPALSDVMLRRKR
jgi:hypothetical protein